MKYITLEKKDYTLLLTLNRPDVMNAICYDMLIEIQEALNSVWFDRNIRVIIVTGAGEKAFCAGADLKEREKMTETQVRNFIRTIRDTFTMFEDIPKPVIAAINGYAFGGGLEMALACDIRIASENAIMGLTETSLAIIPGAGGTQRLPRIVGRAWAKELIYTARRIKAEEALKIGLVTHVVPQNKLLVKAFEIANEIAANGPIAVAQAKFAINKGIEVDIKSGLEIESKAYEVLIPTKDRVEALKAFKEKRKPNFTGE